MKTMLQIALWFRRLYWRLVRPVTRGVRAIVVDKDGKVLLVRHRYGEGLLLPGGRSHKNEKDADALHRELSEEVGISSINGEATLGEYVNTREYKRDTIVVFVVRDYTMKTKSHFEIAESNFFDPSSLPEEISPGTRKRIEEWLGQRNITGEW